MKVRGPIFFSIVLVAGLLIAAYYPRVVNAEKEAVLVQTIIEGLNQFHYKPLRINNEFSQKVFDIYMDKIDGSKRFFTQEEMDQLNSYRDKLDEEAEEHHFEFFNLSLELMEKSMEKTRGYYQEFLSQPFDFSTKETIELNGDKRGYAKNDEELKAYWKQFMKYETMVRLAQKLEAQKGETDESKKKSFEALEEESRKKVMEIYDDIYNRISKLKRSDRFSEYLDAMANVYDPHTGYFQPIDKENFDMRLSGQYEGIGARLLEAGDYTKVTEVMVGGPAWKGKLLDENDVILKVAQGDGEPKDITGMLTNDVVQLIRGKKGTEVRLTVKKLDGTVKVIPIIRDVVVLEEQYAKSLILKGQDEAERIGYIQLPSFYANFNDREEGRSCADDVATEIEKLKRENVKGIILDLRFNGGGSLYDVVKMSGFFIEKGPVVQVKSRTLQSQVLNDKDAGVQWDGPLIVLVNNFSASASEILVAALQDYGRAIIVGSKSTFGKGTVQRFIDLDRAVMGLDDIKPLGQVKVTIQKYYRVNGGSVQLKGVSSDIVLPDNYYYLETGEKEEKFPMEWTEIEPVNYGQQVYDIKGVLPELAMKSQARVAESSIFQKILDNAQRLKQQRDFTNFPLSLEDYNTYTDEVEANADEFNKFFETDVNKNIENLKEDLEAMGGDSSKKERNKEFIQTVSKDVYIQETLNIMHDLISLKQ